MTAMLEVTEVTKAFGGVVANDAITIAVPQGAIVGLIGPNGSGKTTLFNAITGVHAIDSGAIRFKGKNISRLLAGGIARSGIIRTYQQPRVYGGLSARDNMLISASIRRAPFVTMFWPAKASVADRADELLDFVGLYGKREVPAGDLSFGQQKLLELAMALANDPEMLLLDEPTAGINPILIDDIVDRLKAAQAERGLTLLVIEHNMPVIMDLAHHIFCLAHGRLLAEGSPRDIQDNPQVLDAYLGAA